MPEPRPDEGAERGPRPGAPSTRDRGARGGPSVTRPTRPSPRVPARSGRSPRRGFAADMLRARWDVDFFCERFLGFKPHPGQSRLFRAYITRDETRWIAALPDPLHRRREPCREDAGPGRRDPALVPVQDGQGAAQPAGHPVHRALAAACTTSGTTSASTPRSPNSSSTRSCACCRAPTRRRSTGCPLADVLGEDGRRLVEEVPGRVPDDQAPPAAGWGDHPLSDHGRAGHRITGQGHGRGVLRRVRVRTQLRLHHRRGAAHAAAVDRRATDPDRDDDRGPDRVRRQVAGRQSRRTRPQGRLDTRSASRTRENIGYGIDEQHVRPARRRACRRT